MVGFKLKIYKILPLNPFLKGLFLLFDEKTMQAMWFVLSVRSGVRYYRTNGQDLMGLVKPLGDDV